MQQRDGDRQDAHRKWWIRLSLSLLIAGGFCFALFRRIEFVPSDPWLPGWVLPSYLATLAAYFLFRAGRWHYLVEPLGQVDWRTSLAVSMAGTMWIMVLPLRLGEFARPLFLRQKTGIGFGHGLGSVALERVVDGLFVCGLFFIALPLLPSVTGEQAAEVERLRALGMLASAALLLVLVVLLAMALAPAVFGRLVAATLGRIVPPLADKLAGLARDIAEGLAALPSPRALLLFLAGTLAYWAANALGTWLLAVGAGIDLSFAAALAVMSVLGISLLLPGGPAQFGVFHYGLIIGLSMFVDDEVLRARGSVFIFWMFVTQLGVGVALGLIAQRSLDLDWRALLNPAPPRDDREPDPPPAAATEPRPEPER